MKKLLLLLMIVPMFGFGQCVSGDCENGYGLWHSPEQVTTQSGFTESRETYRGEFKDGKFSGQGSYSRYYEGEEDGDWGYYNFIGSFKNGLRDGYCVTTQVLGLYFGEGWQYSGEYKDGERNGIGIIKMRDESGFIGESGFVGYWVNGKFIKEISKF
tara:strand:- start:1040 stop:1510 length:471 start_codon:yes stop_codon:yes gene_type:complete